jgi:DNA-binding PadR family transcriptional regulator
MPATYRSNPLALAVLICLWERPMHTYEVASVLRQRNKHESVRLNFGSLYAIVAALHRRGFVTAQAPERHGPSPERTTYHLTTAGEEEARDWLTTLLAIPAHDFPAFEAALSFLPALAPDAAVALLRERRRRLTSGLDDIDALRERNAHAGLPRIVWIEEEFRVARLRAERDFIDGLINEIDGNTLDGLDWWRDVHRAVAS